MSERYRNAANAIRFLSVDAVQKAKSGHPGMPLGMADVVSVLFLEFFKFSYTNANWFDRDRFILSNGHGSMLLYSLLYLIGYISIDDIKSFRQVGSITPGHPEYGHTIGVEVTTGPLGQGLACAVGMAIAESVLSARLGNKLVNHYTYVVVGDGCLMEGISHEAASLAGHLELNKLIVLFDDNRVSIDGSTNLSVSDDVYTRFISYGWNVQKIDGHNFDEIFQSIKNARNSSKPSIICCKTVIGKSIVTRENLFTAHSGPFKDEEVLEMRKLLNWDYEPFYIPEHIKVLYKEAGEEREREYKKWLITAENYKEDLKNIVGGDVKDSVYTSLNQLKKDLHNLKPNEATRRSSGRVLNVLTKEIPELIGGSADLTESNFTKSKIMKVIDKNDYSGSYLHYGVREHAMAACMNGIALHKGLIPYGGTFLVFSDYCRPAIRLSALMKQRVIYIMTHDSIGLGEDGPTHQPIEHLSSLRSIPNLYVFRPADAVEVLECWEIALKLKESPSMLVLSRQNLNFTRNEYIEENVSKKGAYIISEYDNELHVTMFATGSEVEIALSAKVMLQEKGIGTRVVSIPCCRLFDDQDCEYRASLLNNSSMKVAVEAANSFGWHKYIGQDGLFIGIENFGISGPYKDLYRHFGITAENIVESVINKLKDS